MLRVQMLQFKVGVAVFRVLILRGVEVLRVQRVQLLLRVVMVLTVQVNFVVREEAEVVRYRVLLRVRVKMVEREVRLEEEEVVVDVLRGLPIEVAREVRVEEEKLEFILGKIKILWRLIIVLMKLRTYKYLLLRVRVHGLNQMG